jgi:hypothetical protein
MTWKSDANKFLRVKDGVKLNASLDMAVVTLEPWFAAAQLEAWVTSGIRTSEDQLQTILKYCIKHGVDKQFKEILTCGVMDKIDLGDQGTIYTWQRAWSRLLNIGVIVNPPMPARCLMDYWRNNENRKGILIGHSPHYYEKAIDISGGSDRSPVNEAEVVKKAIAARVPYIRGYLLEPKNNCCHVDTY